MPVTNSPADGPPTRSAAVFLAQFALIWGGSALLPYDLFKTYSLYRYYAYFAPEWIWGTAFVFAGALQWAGAAKGWRHPSMGFVAALLLGAFYTFGALCFFAADPHSPGGPLYALAALWEIRIGYAAAQAAPNYVEHSAGYLARLGKDGRKSGPPSEGAETREHTTGDTPHARPGNPRRGVG